MQKKPLSVGGFRSGYSDGFPEPVPKDAVPPVVHQCTDREDFERRIREVVAAGAFVPVDRMPQRYTKEYDQGVLPEGEHIPVPQAPAQVKVSRSRPPKQATLVYVCMQCLVKCQIRAKRGQVPADTCKAWGGVVPPLREVQL